MTKDTKDISDALEKLDDLRLPAQAVQNAVTDAFALLGDPGQKTKNLLHGTWLGHPLHPLLTDIPLGAWTLAALFDALDAVRGNDDFAPAADVAIGVGLLGAAGAAKTGLADYAASGEQAPNTGLVHGVLNIAATTFYLASLVARRRKKRAVGRGLAWVGYGVLGAAAYLGGELVYGQRIGVDHAQREELPEEWTPVLAENELAENTLTRASVGDIQVLLLRRGQKIHAIGEVCSHLGGPLAEGEFDGENGQCSVTCPWHGSRFDVVSGEVLDGPATYRQPRFEARVQEGQIEIKLPAAQVGAKR